MTEERANFKAESVAIQDIANECSFAPKGTRVEDRYASFAGNSSYGRYKAYAKIAITIDDCEAAKQATDPEKIKALANVAMTTELAQYQKMEYAVPEPGQEVAEEEAAGGGASGANPAINSTSAPPPIQSSGEFFVVRQQVAYAKEVVIMAPPQAYPPGAPQTTAFVNQVQPAATQIHSYEQANPQTRDWHNSWSGFERNPTAPIPASIPRRQNYSTPNRSNMGRQGWQNRGGHNHGQPRPQQNHGGGRGSRRRRDYRENQ